MKRTVLRQLSYLAVIAFGAGIAAPGDAAGQIRYESLTWSPGGTTLTVAASFDGESADLYSIPVGEGPAHRLTTDPGRDVFASWSPDGASFVFASTRGGPSGIYLAAADGSNVRRITEAENEDSWPVWSPEGERIAFMSRRTGRWQIWVMAADGSGTKRVTTSAGNDYNPRWSPDGMRLVFESDRNGGNQDDIYIVAVDGSGERRVTATPGNDVYPDWSPAGDRIAFCTIEQGRAFIQVIPIDGVEPRVIVEDACMPAWSPDGTRLAYQSARRGESVRLVIAGADGQSLDDVPGLEAREIRTREVTPSVRKPNVAILIYDGVQIIDHAAPWEVLGQYGVDSDRPHR